MLTRILRGTAQTEAETLQAASSPLGLALKPFHGLKPRLMVVHVLHYLHPHLFRVAHAFAATVVIFLVGEDIGIGIKDHWSDAVLQHAFQDGRGTWGTTGVEEDLVGTPRDFEIKMSLHCHGSMRDLLALNPLLECLQESRVGLGYAVGIVNLNRRVGTEGSHRQSHDHAVVVVRSVAATVEEIA